MQPEKHAFGVSQYTTKGWSWDEDIEHYGLLGVECIEVCEYKLDRERRAEQLAQVAAHGMSISSVQLALHTVYPDTLEPEPSEPPQRIDSIKAGIVSLAQHLPPGTPFVVNTGLATAGDFQTARRTTVDALGYLADVAEEHGVRIALEPLHPILMNKNSFIWTVEQALDLIDEAGHHALGICLDTWNIWQDPNLSAAIAACHGRVLVAQVSDWHTPRSFADRAIPGEGQIPLANVLSAIESTGYGGPYTLEIFSDEFLPGSLWNVNGSEVIERSRLGIARALESSGPPTRM